MTEGSCANQQKDTEKGQADDATLPKTTASAPVDNADRPNPASVKKGSIMSFFKPIQSSSSMIASSPKSDEPQHDSSPPSSPPQPTAIKGKRKPRLLRFKTTSLPEAHDDETRESDDDWAVEDEDVSEESENTKGVIGMLRSPLQERGGSISNQDGSRNRLDGLNQKNRPKRPPTIQTTLNISSQAAFSECEVCNTVWNPLHPADVKYHTKQHASVLRAKRKLEETDF